LTENFLSKQAPNDVLVFSYIGMKNEELTAKSITLKVMQKQYNGIGERYAQG
jgi:hypothetical protein